MIFPFAFWRPPLVFGAPVISALNYTQGDTLGGGQPIVLTGSWDVASAVPKIDGVALAGGTYTVDSATQITATLPAHAAGAVAWTVSDSGGTSGGIAFEYWSPASITNIKHRWRADQGVTHAAGLTSQWNDLVGAAHQTKSAPNQPSAPAADANYGGMASIVIPQNNFFDYAATGTALQVPISVVMVGTIDFNSRVGWSCTEAALPYNLFWRPSTYAQFYPPGLNSVTGIEVPHIYTFEDDGANSRLLMRTLASAEATGATMFGAASTFGLGHGSAGVSPGGSTFAECFIVSAIMSTTEKQKTAKYLLQRYGLTVPAP